MDTRHILEAKERQIEEDIDALFKDVMTALGDAAKCLVKMDPAVCQSLGRFEESLPEKRRLLEQDCLVAIASQQPVASDLRGIVADMRIASELARMGDYACEIGTSLLEMDGADLEPLGRFEIQRMASQCEQMVHSVIRAYREADAKQARRVIASDSELDAMLGKLVGELMEAMRADAGNVHNGSHMLWIAHNLERYGDRTVNIAHQVIFRIEG